MRRFFLGSLVALTLPVMGAERFFDFGETRENQTPAGFRSALMGKGKPGDWQVILDPVPPLMAPLSPHAPSVSKRPVLAQVAQDPTDEHFPMLIYDDDVFGDVTLTTQFKTVRGAVEQMAGIAFRIQNETNYYVVRASTLGNTFRFYKVHDGERGPPVGPDLVITNGVWHELTVECKGSQIRCLLDGKEQINVTDKINVLTSGKIGFWTKSDSVSYFADAKIVYVPFQPPAQKLVKEILKKYPRLLGLEIFVAGKTPGTTRLVACRDETALGRAGGKAEAAVIGGQTYYGKEKNSVSVVMPVRDRNGEIVAATRVVMTTFKGQTEENAIVRAAPIVKEIQARVQTVEDLAE